jgi:hypothetical protein
MANLPPSADDLRRTIEPQLRPGERLIWIGQPDPVLFSLEVERAYLSLFGLVAVVVVVALWATSHLSYPRSALIAVILMVSPFVAYLLIAAPWRYRTRVLQSIYAITDRRALVYRGVGWSLLWLEVLPELQDTLWSFDPPQIRARRRIPRYNGRTDLVFDGERHYHFTGRGSIRDWVQVGFLGLGNIDEADRLLDEQFLQDGIRPASPQD